MRPVLSHQMTWISELSYTTVFHLQRQFLLMILFSIYWPLEHCKPLSRWWILFIIGHFNCVMKEFGFFFLNFKCSNIDDFLLTNFLTSFPFSAPSNCCILHFIDWADQKIKGLRLLLLRIKKVPILICKFKRKVKDKKKKDMVWQWKKKNYSTWFLQKFERLLCFSMLLWF